ncbi:uncharacterized protein Z519_00897 [Cladophialophora bantiana CBS 173.52]|uniref:Uncharacterized protein n=1 Tax=Cladophialophora bantiana (strain ATCC 10958 / CBS 173.52 / CDC B-1940 / NIH 8579) TaxID=1442370 RepID=A0A0D2IR63_CLAB1|nr:uncharacterized protein Z519_00897 [Cladophialophora bantiana CBS 173.52]KIW99234.1 hypothetical protein Z519_00897 [Cladophialophora bantiana CBS 173.52]
MASDPAIVASSHPPCEYDLRERKPPLLRRIVNGTCGPNDQTGNCTVNVNSTGFESDCTDSKAETYDFDHKNHDNQPFSGKVFLSQIEWNTVTPNIFNFTVYLKTSQTCVDHYHGGRCTFRAATPFRFCLALNEGQMLY